MYTEAYAVLLLEEGRGRVVTDLGKRVNKAFARHPVYDPATLDKAREEKGDAE